MTQPLRSKPTAGTYDVESLVNMALAGRIRVPHFQRDFRWTWEDVRKFFDSILRGYPVGSLLLWERAAPAKILKLGALEIPAPESDSALWVVDGQQRVTSLVNALTDHGSRDPRFSLAYSLASAELIRPPTPIDPSIIPLHVLFDLQKLLRWFAENPVVSDYLDEASSATRRLRQFVIPAYLVQEDDIHVLQDIFDRMNNYGKRLRRAEVFAALNAPDETDEKSTITFETIAQSIASDYSFGYIDDNTVLACILARRGPEVRRDIRNEFEKPNDEGRDAAYKNGEDAIRKAVRFLQDEAGVPHFSLLAYKYLLVVLTRTFSSSEISPRDRELLRRWYWRAALAGPENFKGGSANSARILCGKINLSDISESIRQLLGAVPDEHVRKPDLRRFSAPEASAKIVLCALWAKKPRSPSTENIFTPLDLSESIGDQVTASPAIKNLVPRSQLSEELRPWAANRLIVPSGWDDLANAIQGQPVTSTQADWELFLQSHLLSPEIIDHVNGGLFDDAIKARARLLDTEMEYFIRVNARIGYDLSPPLATLVVNDE